MVTSIKIKDKRGKGSSIYFLALLQHLNLGLPLVSRFSLTSLDHSIEQLKIFHGSSRSFNPNIHLKEQFVSNLEGSSIIEIVALATLIPALFVLRHWMSFGILSDSLHATKTPSKKNNDAIDGCRDWRVYMTALILDFFVIVLPTLLFVTVLADWAQICALFLILLFPALVAIKRIDFSSLYGEKGPQDVYSVRTSISAYRVFVMVLTCLCED